MMYVTRQVHFNAAHRLYNPAWSDARNSEVFGPCANPHGHGHNYELYVTLAGEINPDTGYVFDLGRLKDIIEERVIRHVDHRFLNIEVPFLQGVIPSTENFAIAIWNQLVDQVAPARLHCVRLYETPRNYVEYYG